MCHVGVEVDAGEVPEAELMALEQEMGAVVVVRIGTGLASEDEIRVLVGLGLRRLDLVGRTRQVAGGREHRAVAVVPVVRDVGGAVLERHRTARPLDQRKLGRENVRLRYPDDLGLCIRHRRQSGLRGAAHRSRRDNRSVPAPR